jgi:beta-glucosidase
MGKRIILLIFLMVTIGSGAFAQRVIPYKNPDLPIEKRVRDLMRRMTLGEKVFQLRSQLVFSREYIQKRNYAIGHMRNIGHFMHKDAKKPVTASEVTAAINEDTRKSIEANRLGIPVLQHGEALHGAQWGMATCFPQSIAMAATFDDSLYSGVAQVIAKELRAVGVRQVYAPVVNVSRDPRWGRTEETYGEDILLNSRFGVAYTKALEMSGVISSPKHFADNYGDGGHDSYASGRSWRELREVYLEPFRACIEDGGARSIMASYNSIDGLPCSVDRVLLNDILRREWKFKGFVISDYGGTGSAYAQGIAGDKNTSEIMSFKAGIDVDLPNGYVDLLSAVQKGFISEKQIDISLKRVLTCKFQLGLFEDPYVDPAKADSIVRCKKHQEIALEAARKAVTLLKNKDNVLPLSDKEIKKIGIFGPAANVLSLGDYSGPYGDGWKMKGVLTPYEAIKERLKGKAEVILHKPGQDVRSLANNCDAVIFFGALTEGEGKDRSKLTLPSKPMKSAESLEHAIIIQGSEGTVINVVQEKMIADLAACGKKTIVILQNGSPVEMVNWVDHVDGIIEAWYAGEQSSAAIAEALFGDINPGGRLPVTFPKHIGQVPLYYAIKPSGRGYSYNDDDGKPLFPFGYGLSYTTFKFTNPVFPKKVEKNGTAEIKVTVTNTGTRKGDEVIQLYLQDVLSSVVRPIKELKAFKRVTLEPGESKEVVLSLPYRSFGIYNKDLKFVVEPGKIKFLIANNAEDKGLQGETEVE